jgi:hypothetical protein
MKKIIEEYYNRGWSIIPVKYKTKLPIISWKKYQEERLPLEILMKWYSYSLMNVAVICGDISGGLVGVDIDHESGVKKFLELNEYPDTPTMITPKGLRFFFKGNGVKTTHYLAKDYSISVLGNKAISLLPPSIHPSGSAYRWKDHCTFDDTAVQDFSKINIPTVFVKPERVALGDSFVLEGERNITLFKIGSNLLRLNFNKVNTHKVLTYINKNVCNPPLLDNEVDLISNSIYRYT